jgi:type II secretory pathway pseudopilin PulG
MNLPRPSWNLSPRRYSALKLRGTGVESGHQETEAAGIMDCNHPANNNAKCAFTLRELVVVIAVLSLLGGTFLATLHRAASWRIKKAQCAANLRQFAQVTQLYATENRDLLPATTYTGFWAWDCPTRIADNLLRYGMERRTFYCPGTTPRFNDHLNYLNPGTDSLWGFAGHATGSRVVGYASTFFVANIGMTNQNRTILPEPTKATATSDLATPANQERVLLADATISESPTGTAANPLPAGSFVNVPGGFMWGTMPHISPHLNGNLPAGGNLAFKDGHVAWRKFVEMSQRAVPNSPGFWW